MTNKVDFGNVVTAMVTPFQSNAAQSIDLDGVELLANHLLKNGTDTLLLIGSTGEAAQLSDDERWDIVKRVCHFTPNGSKIMVATSDTNTGRAIRKAQKAFDLGADAILVAVPEYIKPPQQALFNHFNAIAKSIQHKPMIIYNIPSRTGTEIQPQTVAKLALANPNIVGIKQSMGDMDKVSELKALCPQNFSIYSGDDSLTLPMLALGARGVISVASHIEGGTIQKMIQAFQTGDVKSAQELHHLLFPLYKLLFMTTNPLPIKEVLYQKGLIASPSLRTLGEMSEEDKAILHGKLSQFEITKHAFTEIKSKNYKAALQQFKLQEKASPYQLSTKGRS